jgi:thiamine pyrophosphate-dependent acetolactate synthase large subunit-like protein
MPTGIVAGLSPARCAISCGREWGQPATISCSESLAKAVGAATFTAACAICATAMARRGEELEGMAEKLGAPIIKAMLGKDCVPDDSPHTTGSIGLVGTLPSEVALDHCDASWSLAAPCRTSSSIPSQARRHHQNMAEKVVELVHPEPASEPSEHHGHAEPMSNVSQSRGVSLLKPQ